MSAETTSPSGVLQESPRSERAMERLTWAILAASLAGFTVLAAVTVIGVRSAFEYVDTPSQIEATSGIVLYRSAGGNGQEVAGAGLALYQGDEIQLASGSNAVVRMADGTRVDLFSNAKVRVDEARSPRLPGRRAEFQLGVENGAVRFSVAPSAPDARIFQVMTPNGVAQLSEGEYTVRVAGKTTRISTWEGKATILADAQVWEVPPGRKIVIGPDGLPRLGDLLENIVVNGGFSSKFDGWEPWEQNETRADVRGVTQIVAPTELGSPGIALKISRESVAQAHNETGLTQKFQWDVTGARSVYLDMWMKVDSASLSGGGYLGTEYPLMVRLRYQARRGNEEVWTQGFFYANPEQRPTTNGAQIQKGVWIHYREDITKRLAELPAVIQELQILGAGHSFDSSIADVRILVD